MSFFGYAIAPNSDHLCHFYSTSTSIFTLTLVSVFTLLLFIIALNLEKQAGEPLFITVSISSLEWIGYFFGSKKTHYVSLDLSNTSLIESRKFRQLRVDMTKQLTLRVIRILYCTVKNTGLTKLVETIWAQK